MKQLYGTELAAYIKERQAKQVRNLRQAWKVIPKLAIVQTVDNPVISTYVRLKQRYAEDILIETEICKVDQSQLFETIERLNHDESVHGIIIQLPLADVSDTQQAVDAVRPSKDVDGLGSVSDFTPATPLAIDWLLAGYGIDLAKKSIAIVGKGRLVGAPLIKLWQAAGRNLTVFDDYSDQQKAEQLARFDVVVTAVGKAELIGSKAIKIGAVLVDAGTSSEHGKIVGDVDSELRRRDDLTITPEKGGVGPLTICALFENVISAARTVADKAKKRD